MVADQFMRLPSFISTPDGSARLHRERAGLLGLLLWVMAGCQEPVDSAGEFRLEGLRPTERTRVGLNEELILTFSEPVDPASVSADNLSVRDPAGDIAQGEWIVEGRVVRFRPMPVLSPDLSDGGFRPGTDYEIFLEGFPRLSGLRSASGRTLDRCLREPLTTVSEDEPSLLFEDFSPGECGTTWMPQRGTLARPLRVGALEPILIQCTEPLDPRSLRDEDFWIEGTRLMEVRREIDPVTGRFTIVEMRSEPRRIPVRATLRENRHELAGGALEPRARIELQPSEALDASPEWNWELRIAPFPGPSLADFRGNRARRWGRDRERVVPIDVVDEVQERQGQTVFHFLDRTRGFSNPSLGWLDGAAHWGDSGSLTVRFPAAAGDGRDGVVELAGDEDRTDIQAFSLSVAGGEKVRLAPGGGLRILRAQGRITIDGDLERLGSGARPAPLVPFEAGETVSAALARIREEGLDWTVLVAGGDVTIRGRVAVDTPLLIIAGGWIRVDQDAEVSHAPDQLWLMPDGGGLPVDALASRPPLVLDPPLDNLLAGPLRVGVVTSAVPSRGGSLRWLGLEVGGRAGAGSYRVRFLPASGPIDPERAVDHPSLVPGQGQVRILIEMTVPTGGVWDPPSVDHVTLDWAPLGGGG